MASQPRKRAASKSATRPVQDKRQMRRALGDDPRVRALRRRRWAHLRALANDDAFRDETEAVRSDLGAAQGFDPATVDAFMKRFWYPSPAVYLKARQCLERIQSQHWAIDLTAFGANEDATFRLPWLKPSYDKIAEYSFGHSFGPAAARVSKLGIVAMARGNHDRSLLREPKVTNVWTAYLKDCGFTYLKTSSAGIALDRIIEHLGGIYHCQIFQNSGVRQLVDVLSNGSPKAAQFVRQSIYKAIPSEEDQGTKGGEILGNLISLQLLRQGFELQCEKCQRRDWYHLSEVAEQFKCKKCFHVQLVPLLDRHTWSYVSNGLFRLEGKMSGCVTTILALIFFRFSLGFDTKIVSSFDYSGSDGVGERDFAILTSDTFREDVDVIIGECKTTLDLKDKEKKDIKVLGLATGAYIAFAIDATDFSNDDKAYFRELVEAGIKPILLVRKHWKCPTSKLVNIATRRSHYAAMLMHCIALLSPRHLETSSQRSITFGFDFSR